MSSKFNQPFTLPTNKPSDRPTNIQPIIERINQFLALTESDATD